MRIDGLIRKLTESNHEAIKRLAFACIAFKGNYPDAWLAVGDGYEDDWYDKESCTLFDIPLYHAPKPHFECQHGEHLQLVPLWHKDTSSKHSVVREFRLRLEDSGDFS